HEDGRMNMELSIVLGYLNMLISLSMVFFGIRQFREKHLGGKITFKKAFAIGFLICLIASAFYVVGWMIYYNVSDMAQTFPIQYLEYMKEKWTAAGLSATEIDAKAAAYASNMEMYKNPVIMAGMTLMEILPVGLVITFLSALILKKK
ncbi:MAG: DUF4199 domain-containing protein, partial [Bacteroidota bacterium]|nr:DUF4199 domain-containing protein [Bacteroidota bacterium]